jgi:hypothetical protein
LHHKPALHLILTCPRGVSAIPAGDHLGGCRFGAPLPLWHKVWSTAASERTPTEGRQRMSAVRSSIKLSSGGGRTPINVRGGRSRPGPQSSIPWGDTVPSGTIYPLLPLCVTRPPPPRNVFV